MRFGWLGPCEVDRDGVRGRDPRHRGSGPARRRRAVRRRPGRRSRGRHAPWPGRVPQHDGAVDSGCPPLRRPARRLRHGRGRGRAGPRGLGPGRGPGRHDLRRAGRGRQHGRRPPHHRARPGRCRRRRLHGAGAGRRRHRGRPTSRTSTPTAPRRRSTTWSRPGDHQGLREPGPPVTSTKGVTGRARRRRGHRGRRGGVDDPPPGSSRRRPATRCSTPRSPSTWSTGAPRAWEPGPVVSNSFGFGGHNGCLILLPPG